jgi:predicted negative regulator of RcsB-dependent stress response
MQRGTLLYMLGRRAPARKSWEEALFREPSNRLVQLYLHTLDREEKEKKSP